MKVCSRCNIEKEDSEFSKEKKSKDGLRFYCRSCNAEYMRAYYNEIIRPKLSPKKIKRECRDGFRFCIYCETEKAISEFYKRSTNICKACSLAASKKRRDENPELYKKRAAEYRKRRKKQIKEARDKYRRTHNMKGYSGEKAKEYRKGVKNAYIRCLLRSKGIKNSDITDEMIEIKRSLVLLKRLGRKIEDRGVKICSICKTQKPVSEFYIRQWTWKGIKKYRPDNVCKICSNKRVKNYRPK